MSKYHVNPTTGNAGPCSAETRCPFGSVDEHFPSAQEARSAYEAKNAAFAAPQSVGDEQDYQLADEVLGSVANLPDDLEGSVPYVPDYRDAAENFVATVYDDYGDKPSQANVRKLAEEWAKDYSDMPSSMIGGHAVAELDRLAKR